MKANKLLELVVCSQLEVERMGFVYSPQFTKDEADHTKVWAEWYLYWFRSNEVCILDHDSEYLYYYANEDEYKVLERRMECWVENEYGNRVYLFKVE